MRIIDESGTQMSCWLLDKNGSSVAAYCGWNDVETVGFSVTLNGTGLQNCAAFTGAARSAISTRASADTLGGSNSKRRTRHPPQTAGAATRVAAQSPAQVRNETRVTRPRWCARSRLAGNGARPTGGQQLAATNGTPMRAGPR